MIVVPVDAHLVTLTITTPEIVERPVRVGRETRMQKERVLRTREIATKRTSSELAASFLQVNKVFADADIQFQLRSTTGGSVEAPNGSEELDDPGFLMIARSFPAKSGVSLLLVRKFGGKEAGAALESIGVCAVGDVAPDTALAHEFGHLLGLDHQGDIRDLMNPGLSAPGTKLTPSEIATARGSALAQRFAPARTL